MPHTPEHRDRNILGESIRTLPSGVRTTAGADVNTISGRDLTPSPRLPFASFSEPPVFPVADIPVPQIQPIQETQPEREAQGLSDQLQSLTQGLLGESTARAEEEEAQGLPELLQTQTDLSARLSGLQREAQAIPLQIQQESIGRGRTRAGVAPVQIARQRENAIQALGVSSLLEASRGNISLANNLVDRAVAQEFDPIRERISVARANLETALQSPSFNRAERNQALRTQVALEDRERVIDQRAANKKAISQYAQTILEFGGPMEVAEEILANARTPEQAIAMAGQHLQDPAARFKLESLRLDNILTKERINTERAERQALALAGAGTDVTEGIEDEIDAIDAERTLINSVLDSSALDSVVGTSFLSRGAASITGTIGRIGSIVGIPALVGGAIDKITGQSQNLIAGVEQMVDQKFLEKLIDVKSQGATFGALSDAEGNALRAAATKIGTWRIKNDEGKVVGYNASEKAFKDEVRTFKELADKAFAKASGQLLGTDEESLLDQAFNGGILNPAF